MSSETQKPSLNNLATITSSSIRHMRDRDFVALAAQVLEQQQLDRREMQLLYYKPVSEESRKIHLSTAHTVGVGGGNRSSKTETCLVEMIMCATGIIPMSLRRTEEEHALMRAKMRGPINCRIVCESLTTVLHPIMLPKLRWSTWTGIDEPGGDRGHWGWIPRFCLRNSNWEKSWSEKLRTLKFDYRDPDDYSKVLGESTLQFMSYDQDWSDFASGEFHMILHDEPPKYNIWQENEARTMSVNGRNFLAMTWPSEPAINVDWLFDEVYEPAQEGPNKNPDIDWINLYTIDNMNLDQSAVALQASKWGADLAQVRIYGQPIRFSNRIHPLFTDRRQWWCYDCKRTTIPNQGECQCGSVDIEEFNHVVHRDVSHMPVVFLLDPHPRKPHMFAWVAIDPADDWHSIRTAECEGDPKDVHEYVTAFESNFNIQRVSALIDPNMGRSPASTKRGVTWQDEFDAVGLRCDTADDSAVGRKRIDQMLTPDPHTRRPRFTFEPGETTESGVHQMKRYMWDDFAGHVDKDQKQKPKQKYDDFPTLFKYLANSEPTFRGLQSSGQVIRRPIRHSESRRGHYSDRRS